MIRFCGALGDAAGDQTSVQMLPALRGNGYGTPLAVADINMVRCRRDAGDRPCALLSSGLYTSVMKCSIICTENQWSRGLVNRAIDLITAAYRFSGRAGDAAHNVFARIHGLATAMEKVIGGL
ncbi:hypothetical protein [Azospirillum sp. Marseille-Q6669]